MHTMLPSKKTFKKENIKYNLRGLFDIILILQTQMYTSPEDFREVKNPVDKIKKIQKSNHTNTKFTWDK